MDTGTKWALAVVSVAALGGAGFLAWHHLRNKPEAPRTGKLEGELIPGKMQATAVNPDPGLTREEMTKKLERGKTSEPTGAPLPILPKVPLL